MNDRWLFGVLPALGIMLSAWRPFPFGPHNTPVKQVLLWLAPLEGSELRLGLGTEGRGDWCAKVKHWDWSPALLPPEVLLPFKIRALSLQISSLSHSLRQSPWNHLLTFESPSPFSLKWFEFSSQGCRLGMGVGVGGLWGWLPGAEAAVNVTRPRASGSRARSQRGCTEWRPGNWPSKGQH